MLCIASDHKHATFYCNAVIIHWKCVLVHREMKTDSLSSTSKLPKGSESPNFFLDQKSRKRTSDTDNDKLSSGCPIEANVLQPRMREHKSSRGQYLLTNPSFYYSSCKCRVGPFLKINPLTNVNILSQGKPRPLSMPADTCVKIADTYAKPWAQGRKGMFYFIFLIF